MPESDPIERPRAPLSGVRAALEAAHAAALGVWVGALVMTGAAAAVAFPTMRAMSPSLPEFASYPEDHWMIAAGRVMARVFFISDMAQLICASLAALSLAALWASGSISRRRAAQVIRAALLAALLLSLAQYLLFPARQMAQDLHSFWTAAAAGDIEQADEHRAAFDSMHGAASMRLALHSVGALATLLVGAWAAATPERDRLHDKERSA